MLVVASRARASGDDEGFVAIARGVDRPSQTAVSSDRGTICSLDERAPRAAFTVKHSSATREDAVEVNAMTFTSDHALFYALGSRVVEADARMASDSRVVDANAPLGGWAVRVFESNADVVNGLDVDVSGRCLAACDDSGEIVVYDARTGAVVKRLRGHDGCATAVAFRRKRGAESELLTTATDCRAMKWDHRAKTVPVRTWDVRSVRSARDHDRAHSGAADESSDDGGQRMFNPPMLHSVSAFEGETCAENAPGARRVACAACGDGTIMVFDADLKAVASSSGKKLSSASSKAPGGAFRDGRAECVRLGEDGVGGHANAATCAGFVPWLPRGDIIVSGGADRRLIAWNWVSVSTPGDFVDDPSARASGVVADLPLNRKINDLAFVRDSRRIVVVDTGPKVTFIDFTE